MDTDDSLPRDPLTGAFSHDSTLDIRMGSHVAMINLVDFRSFNERHGHHAGDLALKGFAERLMLALDPWRVFRFGGNDFLVEIPDGVELQDGRSRIVGAVQSQPTDSDDALETTIGFCLFAVAGDPMDAIIVADDARFRARVAGRPVHEAAAIHSVPGELPQRWD